MENLHRHKTIGGFSATDLIDHAEVIKTKSGDYLIRVKRSDYDLDLTDDYDLCVSGIGVGICVMTINNADCDKLSSMHDTCEQNYHKDQLSQI